MKILFVGDVFSKLGRETLARNIKKIKEEQKINFIIINGENITHGKGMNEGHYKWLLEQGANVITLGNHSFQQRSIFNFIDDVNNVVRPYNLENVPGKGYVTINYNGIKITVFQMIGKVLMDDTIPSPFEKTKELLENVDSDIFICDFHAETTSEKIAFGYAFDGQVHAILGTHTHVQTSDGRILENGTAFIGGNSSGRIEFDGNSGLIASASHLNASKDEDVGTWINLQNGTFSFGDGKLTFKQNNDKSYTLSLSGIITAKTGGNIGGWTILSPTSTTAGYIASTSDVNADFLVRLVAPITKGEFGTGNADVLFVRVKNENNTYTYPFHLSSSGTLRTSKI